MRKRQGNIADSFEFIVYTQTNKRMNNNILQLGDTYPQGDCIDSQRCDNVSGNLVLVNVPAAKPCSGKCEKNNFGIYYCKTYNSK